uniref:F180B protein n=1 Tax=Otus sunia TaxID=257818 RepID=A0A8C8E635_9STRI
SVSLKKLVLLMKIPWSASVKYRRQLAEGLCWASRAHAALLFQMLWGGLDIQANRTIRLRDEELASLRPARQFMRILEDEVPKTQTEIEQHLRYYSLTDTHLPVAEFDRLLFTSVYCAYQVRSTQGLDKNLWISFFSQLVDEIFRDLLCPQNQEYNYFIEEIINLSLCYTSQCGINVIIYLGGF